MDGENRYRAHAAHLLGRKILIEVPNR